tara:strand:- start:693 stop:833 length:141 start_codon:yes stop_codon:yes gene_type:complete
MATKIVRTTIGKWVIETPVEILNEELKVKRGRPSKKDSATPSKASD